MPNNIMNLVSVLGEPNEVTAFIAAARGAHPKTGDVGRFGQENNPVPPPIKPFNFHSLVPLPDEYGRNPYGDKSPHCGWNLECDTWGIKWGSYQHAEPEVDPGLATYRFDTAWDGPYEVFMPKVAARFPSLLFMLSWGGEGPTRGRMTFCGSRKSGKKEEYRERDYPAWSDNMTEGEENTHHNDYEAAENIRLTSHPLWVGLVVARRRGQIFKPRVPAPILADWLQDEGYDNLAVSVRAMEPTVEVGPMTARAVFASK